MLKKIFRYGNFQLADICATIKCCMLIKIDPRWFCYAFFNFKKKGIRKLDTFFKQIA